MVSTQWRLIIIISVLLKYEIEEEAAYSMTVIWRQHQTQIISLLLYVATELLLIPIWFEIPYVQNQFYI